jgi:hypothetical protein
MGYILTLTNYVDEQSKELISALQFEGETAKFAQIEAGVKSSKALQILAVQPVPQGGESCGFTASGSATFTQRNIVTKAIKWQDSLCPKTLQSKCTQLLLKAGQKYTEADIPAKVIDELVAGIKAQIEKMDWQGNILSGNPYLSKYDGLAKIIEASGAVAATTSTYNATNARAIVKDILNKIPASLKGNPNVKMFMGYDAAEIYRQVMMDANLYHVASTADQRGLYAEGSVVEIVPVHGLDATSKIFTLQPTNMFLGVDMLDEEEVAKLWFSDDDDVAKYTFACRRGWQVAIPSEIVYYKNT